jgi:hypothetical protein
VVQPDRSSAGEGQSHKAHAYVYEESHSGILPMNHSNKDGTSPAESGEGRGAVDNAADLARCKSLCRILTSMCGTPALWPASNQRFEIRDLRVLRLVSVKRLNKLLNLL